MTEATLIGITWQALVDAFARTFTRPGDASLSRGRKAAPPSVDQSRHRAARTGLQP